MSTEQVTQTVKDLMSLLLPVVPYLSKGIKAFGKEFAKSAGEKTGEVIPNVIQRIWDKLRPKIRESAVAENALQKVVKNPQDQRATGALELAVEDLLRDDRLRGELIELLHEAKERGITVEQITHLGQVYGEIVNVDVDDASSLHNAKINSELTADEIKEGGKVTGVRLGKKKG